MTSNKYWRAFYGFMAGFATCMVLTRAFVTNDATVMTFITGLFVPFWLGLALSSDEGGGLKR